MLLINRNIERPSFSLIVCVIFMLLGIAAIFQLPVKLLPDTTNPELKIETLWRGASPYEIEANILEKQENVLRDIANIEEIRSMAYQGRGVITLSVANGVNRTELLINILSKLNNVKAFPIDAEPPKVKSLSSAGSLVFLFLRKKAANDTPIDDYDALIETSVRSRLESIEGVAGVETFIGAKEEYQIIIDPLKAAYLGVSLIDVAKSLKDISDISSGTMAVGRKQYLLRLAAQESPQQIEDLILQWRQGNPVRLKDIADVQIRRGKRESFAVYNGEPAIGLRLTRAVGANVLATLDRVFYEIEDMNQGLLVPHQLQIEKSFDPSIFINRSLMMVSSNIIIGILMAMSILFLFFKRWQPTLIVGISVPLSLLVSFVFLFIFDRTINVITLAGLAFASGMVMDATIVVLESITQQREQGKSIVTACIQGTSQVWKALLTSTLTTVAIFLPIAFTDNSDAELFSDLALAITASVVMSLFVALFIIPIIYKKLFSLTNKEIPINIKSSKTLSIGWLRRLTETKRRQISWIVLLILGPLVIAASLLPELDYLPPLRKDSVDTFMRFPASAHLDLIEQEIVLPMVDRLQPYLDGTQSPSLKNYFIAVSPGVMSMAVRAKDQAEVNDLKALIINEVTADFPDTQTYSSQGSITGKFGGNRSFTFHIQSDDLMALKQSVETIIPKIKDKIPNAVVKASPSLSGGQPELRVTADNEGLSEAGWDYTDFKDVIKIMGDGLYIGEYFNGKDRINKIVKTTPNETPEQWLQTPLSNHNGRLIYLNNIAEVKETQTPLKLSRVNRRRAISLTIIPPPEMTLGVAVATIEQLLLTVRSDLPADASILMGKTANKLNQSVTNLMLLLFVAILLLFIIIAMLFNSIRHGLLVTMTLPLAAVGGVLMLMVLNIFTVQTLDLLTLIGFIILSGLVVNNAILLVCAFLDNQKAGSLYSDAVYQAVQQRMRPILISTLTSIFGMLPLLLNPGTGSEIYRGLAAVVVGGMTVSLIFTLILIPCLLLVFRPKTLASPVITSEINAHA
ncbi:efflux RND transporter permease subunit [uncultured Shewanella sp.]|uniref:efflux RND transporter permease subunit n=1 Tax=uncultured Shewanella sp. TaxID=173975 RepID=UPI002622B5F7|nr:efflux RND transporter permease subunit [uncultured Shewanella sp.]